MCRRSKQKARRSPAPCGRSCEKHRDNAQCAGCHSKIDPYGLALENFNAIGVWRTQGGGIRHRQLPARLPNGKSFKNVDEFRAVLNDEARRFPQGARRKAADLRAGPRFGIRRRIRGARRFAPTRRAEQDRFSSVILAIVESDLFQKRTAKGN